MKLRVTIPDDLAAKVMFAADRTCCACRLEKHNVQIHHIDEDPSNNAFENLAVICLHCHSDAHTTGTFVRRLTPELIRLYNRSWREIVQLRLMPSGESAEKREFAAEGFLEASLNCHSWKVIFMSLAGPNLQGGQSGQFRDVWDAMAELWVPQYSEENYRKYHRLFVDGIEDVLRRFDRLVQLFHDVFPHDFRAMLVRAHRQLEVERSVYVALPSMRAQVVSSDEIGSFFGARFIGVIHVLRDVARNADRRRELLVQPAGELQEQ